MSDRKIETADLVAEAQRREAELAAQFIHNADKDRQRDLFSRLLMDPRRRIPPKRVHDIVEFQDDNGDDILVVVYVPIKPYPEIAENTTCIVQIMFLEQKRTVVRFDEVMFRGGRYWTTENENLILKLKSCKYPY